MRYPAFVKTQIIQLMEQSHLPIKQALAKLGIPSTISYRWHDLWRLGGFDALDDRPPLPGHVMNRLQLGVRRYAPAAMGLL